MSTKKTHWRSIDKSDHFGAVDLDEMGGKTTATIISVVIREEVVAGKKGIHRIATFKEGLKPMSINTTNGKVLERAIGSKWVEDWADINIQVDMYVKSGIRFGKDTVDGVRFAKAIKVAKTAAAKPAAPAAKKVLPALPDDRFEKAFTALQAGSTTSEVLKKTYSLTADQLKKIEDEEGKK